MLKRPAERILVNKIDSNTIIDSGDFVIIAGLTFPKESLISETNKCIIYCASPCVQKEVTVTVALPAESCGCIEEWPVKIVEKMSGNYTLNDVRPKERVYIYDVPVGTTPTELEIATEIVRQINKDKEANYTAVDNADNTFTITGKDDRCIDFDVYLPMGMGSVAVATEFVREVLSPEYMSQLFPIGHGTFASRPELPLCGTYCKYVIKFSQWTQDLAHSLGFIAAKSQIEFYVNKDDPDFNLLWATKLEPLMDCCACDFTLANTAATGAAITITGTDCDEDDVESIVWSIDDPDAEITDGQGTDTIVITGGEAGDIVTVTVTFTGCGPITKSVTLT
jgi:hypothetical protein